MPELATPSIGLETQSYKAQTSPSSNVDLMGVQRAMPDYNSAINSISKLFDTIAYMSDKAKANDLYNQLQQDLGDVERSYITAKGRGSREEMLEVESQANKILTQYDKDMNELDARVHNEFTDQAKNYKLRFRDSILNNAAKKAEELTVKNLDANVANAAEDYVAVMDRPKDKNYKYLQGQFYSAIEAKLAHDKMLPEDPYYKQAFEEAVSKARVQNAQYHLANKDYDKAWRSYWQGVESNEFTVEDRNTVLAQLRNWESERMKEYAASQKEASRCYKNFYGGSATVECQEFILATFIPRAQQIKMEEYRAREAAWQKRNEAYQATRGQATITATSASGIAANVADNNSVVAEPGPRPEPPAQAEIEQEAMMLFNETLQKNKENATMSGRVRVNVREKIAAIPLNERPKDPLSLLVKIGVEDPQRVKNNIDDGLDNPTEFWNEMMWGSTPTKEQQTPYINRALNMPLSSWSNIVARSAATGNDISYYLQTEWNLTPDNAKDVSIQWQNKVNEQVSEDAIDLENNIVKRISNLLIENTSSFGGMNTEETKAWLRGNNDALRELVRASLSEYKATNKIYNNIGLETYLSGINGKDYTGFDGVLKLSEEKLKQWRKQTKAEDYDPANLSRAAQTGYTMGVGYSGMAY